MNLTEPVVRDVPPGELTACLQWLLASVRVERAQWIVAQLTERVKHKKISDIIAVDSSCNGELSAAAIAVLASPNAANLLAIHSSINGGFDASKNVAATTTTAIFRQLVDRLRAAQVTFLQASTDPESETDGLVQLGFERLATLAFLVLESDAFEMDAAASVKVDSRFVVVGDDADLLQTVCDIAEKSFLGSQDCPRLSDFRSATEIVDGYRLASSFDPSLWRLMMVGGEPAGCLLLTRHPVSSEVVATDKAFEITYMGLVPKLRGRRLGRQLLVEAVRVARQENAIRMVLAVDLENSPANTLYRQFGWQEAARESVWAMRIKP